MILRLLYAHTMRPLQHAKSGQTSPTRSSWCLWALLLLFLSFPLVAQDGVGPSPTPPPPIDTFGPGPYGVGRWDWNFGQVQVTTPGSSGSSTITVDHFGTFRYPALADGTLAPIAPGWPFPFVVFAHGRYHVNPYIGHNHEGADYLIDHLASHGFIVASVNLDVVGQYGSPAAIPQRAELIHHTIDAFETLDPTGILMDWNKIGIVGHSRGGEGSVKAAQTNPQGHAIGAVATISPTDFGKTQLEDVPYLSILGSKDGDVSNGWPIMVFDRSEGNERVFEYVEGANHFWFTDDIHFSFEGNADITRNQHHDVARTYITAFLKSQIGQAAPQSFAELSDGPSLFPVTDPLDIHPVYHHPEAFVVNDFEDTPHDPSANSLGGVSAGDHLLVMDEENLKNTGKTFYHESWGGWIEYDMSNLLLTYSVEEIPVPVDVRSFDVLSVGALQRYNAPLNTANSPQDFQIVLADHQMRLAAVRLSQFGTIPWPRTHTGFQYPNKSVLRTTRIPLFFFAAQNPNLDLSAIKFIGFVYDQTDSADLRIDNISFSD